MNGQEALFNRGNVVFSYTRAQALEDGVLVDLTEWARETGFVIPVACTSRVWHDYIVPPEKIRDWGQSERGRAHDLLWMLFTAIKSRKVDDLLYFETIFLQKPRKHQTVKFKTLCGPGDTGEPVLTIMMPDED